MNYWWVNLGDTYKFVKINEYLWAPKRGKNNNIPFHWKNMSEVNKNDIIFCYSSGYLRGYAMAKNTAYAYDKPFDTEIENEWENEGNRIDLEYIELKNPIKLTSFSSDLYNIQPSEFAPINIKHSVNQGYIYSLNMKSGRFLLKIIDKLNDLKFNLNRTLSEIKNKESILSAISEYDKIGGYAFLNRYGFDPSLKYFLYYNNKLYDSKAIVGVSYRYEYPTEEYLSSNEFSGGQDTVVALLKNLEFTVLEKSITTACYLALKKTNKESSIEEIKEKILDEKLYDFGAQDINDVIRVQIERYCDNVERKQQHNRKLFHKIDTSIYTLIEFLNEHNINENEVNDVEIKYESATEGEKKFKFTSFYERDSKLRKRAIQYHGTTCYACGFNFEEFYGEYAKDYIHIHHTKPLFETFGTQEVDPIKDLVPVCANCHSIIHRRKNETKSIDEVKEMIRMQRLI